MKYYRPFITPLAGTVKRAVLPVMYRGDAVLCSCCSRLFRAWRGGEYGSCPFCSSGARHRGLWMYLEKELAGIPNTGCDLLHFAPEGCLSACISIFDNICYTTTDLDRKDVDIRTDITNMSFADESFDIVINSHVLEHIPDDKAAMQEIFRVLRPGGRAIIQVPGGTKETTYEDPKITDPEERLKHFGQRDHVRVYGMDIADRLKDCGFQVSIVFMTEAMTQSDETRFGLWKDPIYICTKK